MLRDNANKKWYVFELLAEEMRYDRVIMTHFYARLFLHRLPSPFSPNSRLNSSPNQEVHIFMQKKQKFL